MTEHEELLLLRRTIKLLLWPTAILGLIFTMSGFYCLFINFTFGLILIAIGIACNLVSVIVDSICLIGSIKLKKRP